MALRGSQFGADVRPNDSEGLLPAEGISAQLGLPLLRPKRSHVLSQH